MQSPQFVDYHQNRKIINKGAKSVLASKSAPSRNSALRSYAPSICRFPYVARLQQTRKYRIKTSNHNNRRKFSDKIETINVSAREHAEEWYLPAGLLFCRSMNMKIQREKVAFVTSFVFRRLCRLLDSPAFIMGSLLQWLKLWHVPQTDILFSRSKVCFEWIPWGLKWKITYTTKK